MTEAADNAPPAASNILNNDEIDELRQCLTFNEDTKLHSQDTPRKRAI